MGGSAEGSGGLYGWLRRASAFHPTFELDPGRGGAEGRKDGRKGDSPRPNPTRTRKVYQRFS